MHIGTEVAYCDDFHFTKIDEGTLCSLLDEYTADEMNEPDILKIILRWSRDWVATSSDLSEVIAPLRRLTKKYVKSSVLSTVSWDDIVEEFGFTTVLCVDPVYVFQYGLE